MSVNSTGASQGAAQEFIQTLIQDGVNIVLIGNSQSVGYTAGNLNGFETKSEPVSEPDLTINTPSGFAGTAELVNDNQVNFGTVNIGEVIDVVIQKQSQPDVFIVSTEVNDPETSGQTVTLPSGTTLYSFGNP